MPSLRRLICLVRRSCNVVVEVDRERMVARFRCTRCGNISGDMTITE